MEENEKWPAANAGKDRPPDPPKPEDLLLFKSNVVYRRTGSVYSIGKHGIFVVRILLYYICVVRILLYYICVIPKCARTWP